MIFKVDSGSGQKSSGSALHCDQVMISHFFVELALQVLISWQTQGYKKRNYYDLKVNKKLKNKESKDKGL
jgi:hypothetical protein